jgi:hypothetical protein
MDQEYNDSAMACLHYEANILDDDAEEILMNH